MIVTTSRAQTLESERQNCSKLAQKWHLNAFISATSGAASDVTSGATSTHLCLTLVQITSPRHSIERTDDYLWSLHGDVQRIANRICGQIQIEDDLIDLIERREAIAAFSHGIRDQILDGTLDGPIVLDHEACVELAVAETHLL